MLRYAQIILLTLLLSSTALAQIRHVEVLAQTVGSSPLDAQEKAIDYAKKRAFFLTLSRIAPERAEAIAKSLTSEQINSIVRGYELMNEKITPDNPNAYLAQYKVSVSEPMIRRLLAQEGESVNEANPMLILPVLREGDSLMLWEDENQWRKVWNNTALESGEGILIVPYGDPNDLLAVSAATVLSAGFAALKPMADRYGAGEVVIVEAALVKQQSPQGVGLLLRRLGEGVDKTKSLYFEVDSQNQTAESLLPMAARAAATQLKEIARTYQGNQLRRVANAKKLQLRAEFTRLDEWVRIKNKLESLTRVVELHIGQIGTDHANATLLYETTPEMMADIMRASGLFLTQGKDEWVVRAP